VALYVEGKRVKCETLAVAEVDEDDEAANSRVWHQPIIKILSDI